MHNSALLALTASVVSAACTVDPLVDATSGGSTVINWTCEASDPCVFSYPILTSDLFADLLVQRRFLYSACQRCRIQRHLRDSQ